MRSVYVVWVSSKIKSGKVISAIFTTREAAIHYRTLYLFEHGSEYHLEVEAYDLRDEHDVNP